MAEDEIKTSLEEKNILLEEIHHRVENNLQTISNLMGLEYTQLNDKEPIEIYQESQNRVKTIALIHETLSRSEDFAIIDFNKYAHDLINHLFKSYTVDKNINAKIKIDGILLDIDTAVPCGLILNELVTNSIKHAFPSSYFEDRKLLKSRFTQPSNREFVNDQFKGQNDITGEINIFFTLDDGNFTLKVGDNGIGLPDDIDFRYAETSGLQLVNALVRQLDGLIDLEKDNGCEFKIIFRESSV